MQTAPGQIYLDFHSGFKKSVYETWAKSFKKHNSFSKKKYNFVKGKVHIFWEGRRRFVLCSNSQIYDGYFAKIEWLLRIYKLYRIMHSASELAGQEIEIKNNWQCAKWAKNTQNKIVHVFKRLFFALPINSRIMFSPHGPGVFFPQLWRYCLWNGDRYELWTARVRYLMVPTSCSSHRRSWRKPLQRQYSAPVFCHWNKEKITIKIKIRWKNQNKKERHELLQITDNVVKHNNNWGQCWEHPQEKESFLDQKYFVLVRVSVKNAGEPAFGFPHFDSLVFYPDILVLVIYFDRIYPDALCVLTAHDYDLGSVFGSWLVNFFSTIIFHMNSLWKDSQPNAYFSLVAVTIDSQ